MAMGPLRSKRVGVLLSAIPYAVPAEEQNRDFPLFKASKQVFCSLISQLVSTLAATAA